MTNSKISLTKRFWMTSLGLLTAMSLFFGLILSNLLSPKAAQLVVKMDEENRLFHLAQTITRDAPTDLAEYWRINQKPNTTLEKQEQVSADAVSVPISDSGYALVSHRPLTVKEARKAVPVAVERQLLVLLGILLFLYFVAARLATYVTQPLRELTEAAKALASGEREVEVPVPQEAELAELAQSFNQMTRELGKREDELNQALEAKQRIFATTNHELRTPLTVILGYCKMLEDGLKGDLSEAQTEAVGKIHRNAGSLLRQVETLLTLSRLRAQSLPFEYKDVKLAQLSLEVMDSLSGLAEKKGLELKTDFQDEDVTVCVDPKAAVKIVSNLLSNAIKYTDKGSISLAIERTDESVSLLVSDTGPGIPDSFTGELFQEFSRGSETEGVEGTGLGLALSRQLAENMNGSLKLKSTSPKGSCFVWKVSS